MANKDVLKIPVDLINHTPDKIRESPQIQAYINAIEPEFEVGRESLYNFGFEFSPNTATEWGVRRWERALDLHPALNDTLDDRRQRIIIALNEQKPVTKVRLHRLLAALCGETGYHFEVHNLVAHFELYNQSKVQILQVLEMFDRLLPMNIMYDTTNIDEIDSQAVYVYGAGDYTLITDIPYPTTKGSIYVYGYSYARSIVDIYYKGE